MKQKIRLRKRKLKKFITDTYNIHIVSIAYSHFAKKFHGYTLKDAWGRAYFLKILDKSKETKKEMHHIKEELKHNFFLMFRCKLDFISYPLVTTKGNFAVDFSDHILILYRHIEGKTPRKKLNSAQLHDLGKKLAMFHDCYNIVSKKMYPKDIVNVRAMGTSLKKSIEVIESNTKDMYVRKLRKVLHGREGDIQSLFDEIAKEKKKLSLQKSPVLMHGNLIKENLIIDKDTVSMVGLDHVAFGDREKDIAMYASHPRIKSLIEGYDRYKTTSSEVTLKKSLIIFYYKYKLLQDIEDHIDSIVYENNKNIKKRSLKELKQNILPMVHKRNNVIKHIQEIL